MGAASVTSMELVLGRPTLEVTGRAKELTVHQYPNTSILRSTIGKLFSNVFNKTWYQQ